MEETVQIERMAYGPAAVAHLASGKTVFVDHGIAGDVAQIRVTAEKPTYARATISQIQQPSPHRVTDCPCKNLCGGCPWAFVSYDFQLQAKRSHVVDALTRVAHWESSRADQIVADCVPSPRRWGYRNKIELAARQGEDGRIELGFFDEGTHRLQPIDTCPIAVDLIQKSPRALRGSLRYSLGDQDVGLFRVGVRGSLRTHSLEVALWTTPGGFPRAMVAKTLKSAMRPTSVVRVLAVKGKARAVKKTEVLGGRGYWEEDLSRCRYRVSAPSFFQVNSEQAEKLTHLALSGLQDALMPSSASRPTGDFDLGGSYIADLYAGVGTFSLALAHAGADVVAVESAGSSFRDLRRNVETHDLDVEVIGGDAARELQGLKGVEALVVDPPRSGLSSAAVEAIARLKPYAVIYVSCDPQTWARDIQRFGQAGYELMQATPVDMFPQTYHVETVSVLRKAPPVGRAAVPS